MQRTSEILVRLAEHPHGDRISLAEILARLRGRSFGILLILFAAPNCIPMPPGFSTIAGAAIAVVAIQLIAARTSLRVPRFLARRSFASADLTRIVGWVAPKLARVERWSRPRAVRLTRLQARRVLGILILVLAGIMALPIPIVGNTPPAIAIILIGFGMIERDGVFVGTGVVVGLIAIGVIIGLAIGFQEALAAYWPAGWWPF